MIDKGKKMSDKLSVLKDYFGHDSFRDGQEQIVDALLDGRDTLCIMPTGAGKSMCYQIPALLFDRGDNCCVTSDFAYEGSGRLTRSVGSSCGIYKQLAFISAISASAFKC